MGVPNVFASPDDHLLSLLAVILELVLLLLRKAVAMGLVNNSNYAVYVYHPCNATSSTQECNKGAGIVFLVILALLSLTPLFLTLVAMCFNCCQSSEEGNDSDLHYSPIITLFHIGYNKVKKEGSKKTHKNPTASTVSHVIKSITVACYFIGNNLDSILHEYGQCLSCDYTCVETVRQATKGIVIASTLIFHILPPFVKYLAEKYNWEYKPSSHYEVLGIFGVILKAQSTYSSIDGIFQSHYHCSQLGQALGWGFIIFIVIIATANIGIKVELYLHEKPTDEAEKKVETTTSKNESPTHTGAQETKTAEAAKTTEAAKTSNATTSESTESHCCLFFIFLTLTLVFILMFLMTNNQQPLDCAFKCEFRWPSDRSSASAKGADCSCDVKDNTITRLTLVSIASIIGIPIVIILTSVIVKKHRELTAIIKPINPHEQTPALQS